MSISDENGQEQLASLEAWNISPAYPETPSCMGHPSETSESDHWYFLFLRCMQAGMSIIGFTSATFERVHLSAERNTSAHEKNCS